MSKLRRDGGLFALLCVFVLGLGSLQPLATANATVFSGLGVICSGNHVAAHQTGGGQPTHAPGSSDCPCCIGGVCPMVAGPAKAILDESASVDLVVSADIALVVFGPEAASHSLLPLRYPAPIRAPPPRA